MRKQGLSNDVLIELFRSPSVKEALRFEEQGDWFLDDISFCGSECGNTACRRHPENIRIKTIPHSFGYFKDTDMCPLRGNSPTHTPNGKNVAYEDKTGKE